jgi:hypothetical protein
MGHPQGLRWCTIGTKRQKWPTRRQARFYDFNVWGQHKRVQKLRYMHANPVKRGLVLEPGQWAWSSFRDYEWEQPGPVKLNQWPKAGLKRIA